MSVSLSNSVCRRRVWNRGSTSDTDSSCYLPQTVRTRVGHSQPAIQRLPVDLCLQTKQSRHEFVHRSQSSAEIKKKRSNTSTLPYVFMKISYFRSVKPAELQTLITAPAAKRNSVSVCSTFHLRTETNLVAEAVLCISNSKRRTKSTIQSNHACNVALTERIEKILNFVCIYHLSHACYMSFYIPFPQILNDSLA